MRHVVNEFRGCPSRCFRLMKDDSLHLHSNYCCCKFMCPSLAMVALHHGRRGQDWTVIFIFIFFFTYSRSSAFSVWLSWGRHTFTGQPDLLFLFHSHQSWIAYSDYKYIESNSLSCSVKCVFCELTMKNKTFYLVVDDKGKIYISENAKGIYNNQYYVVPESNS